MKAAIGEDATDEELGGAEMHATVTGLGEYLAENDADAIAIAREIVAASCAGTKSPPRAAAARTALRRR